MVAQVLSIVPKRFRFASAAGAAWLASELLALGALASCNAEPLVGAMRAVNG